MSQLQDNLNEILRQKNTYLLPANLRAGVTLLGVEGTYGGTHDTVKLFPSVAAMNADTDKVLGDIAIVLDTTTGVTRNVQENDFFHKLYLPATIIFTEIPQWIQDVAVGDVKHRAADLYDFDTGLIGGNNGIIIRISKGETAALSEMTITFEFMDEQLQLEYSSTDGGYTWVPNDQTELGVKTLTKKYKLGQTQMFSVTDGPWQDVCPFIQAIFDQVIGLYECRSVNSTLTYTALETQLTPITAGDVYENKVVMGNNNTIVTGTVTLNQTEINTATETSENILGEPEIPETPDPADAGGEGNIEHDSGEEE